MGVFAIPDFQCFRYFIIKTDMLVFSGKGHSYIYIYSVF